jgi:hypothetical protein
MTRIQRTMNEPAKPRNWCPDCGSDETSRGERHVYYECGSTVINGVLSQSEECRRAKAWGGYFGGYYDDKGVLR